MENVTYQRHRRSIGWPLLLMAVGGIFLLNNLGILKGDAWDMVVRFWPLLLVIGGLDAIYRGDGIAGAIFMVSLGTIILLNNLGYLALDIWDLLFRFWPILVILVGVDIILGRYFRSVWASVIGLILVIVVLGGIGWYVTANPISGQIINTETVEIPMAQVNHARINLTPAVGNVQVKSLPGSDYLLKGNFQKRKTGQIEQNKSIDDGFATYTVRSRDQFYDPFIPGNNQVQWQIELASSIPFSLDISLGIGQANLDLSKNQIDSLNVKTAIGKTVITIPAQGHYRASIDSAIGQTILRVPKDLPVRITTSHGIAHLDVKGEFQQNGNILTSYTYNRSTDQVEVSVNQAIGNLIVQSVP